MCENNAIISINTLKALVWKTEIISHDKQQKSLMWMIGGFSPEETKTNRKKITH